MTFSIRNILVGIFGLLSVTLSILIGRLMWASYNAYQVSSAVAQLAALDKELFNGLMNFRNERGNSISALKMPSEKNAAVVKTLKSDRANVENAFSVAIAANLSEPELVTAWKAAIPQREPH